MLADGKSQDIITEYFVSLMALDLHKELCFFFLTNLSSDNPLILDLPWLQMHNPDVDWSSMTLAFTSKYCRHHCLP